MVERRSRQRPGASRSAPRQVDTGAHAGGVYGARGYERAKEEQEKAAARRELNQRGPLRFWLEDGDEAEIIILDETPQGIYWQHEHEVWDGKQRHYIPCDKDRTGCVICDAADAEGKESIFRWSYYGMFFTVLDLREYEIKGGDRQGEIVPHTKKLMCIKSSDVDTWWKLVTAAEKQNGTVRGTFVVVSRNGKTAARTGTPQILDNGMLFEPTDEDTLVNDFGHDAVVKDGKEIVPADNDITPYDYDALFKIPDQSSLAKAWGLPEPDAPPPRQQSRRGGGTSRREMEAELDSDQDAGEEGDGQEDAPQASSRSRGRGRGAAAAPATQSRRGRGSPAPQEEAAPAGRSRGRGRSAPEPEPEQQTTRGGRSRGRTEAPASGGGSGGRGTRGRTQRPAGTGMDDEIPF